jgi:hypothetical protein
METAILSMMSLLLLLTLVLILLVFRDKTPMRRNTTITEREIIISKLSERIRTGESSALVSPIREEKSEILRKLNNNDKDLYGEEADKIIFYYLDIGDLSEDSKPDDFWQQFLKLEEYSEDSINDYLNSLGEKRLVLLLDRFDKLLDYKNFRDNFQFFSILRRLSGSKTPSPLSLVIATNLSIQRIVEEIQSNKAISQVLNFIETVPILAADSSEIDEILEILALADVDVNDDAKKYIKDMIGWSSYLTLTTLSYLRDSSLLNEEFNKEKLQRFICDSLKSSLISMLKAWPKDVSEVFLKIYSDSKVDDNNYLQALSELEMQGIIEKYQGKWQLRAKIFKACFKIDEIKSYMSKLQE